MCCVEARDRIRDARALSAYLATIARRKLARHRANRRTPVELDERLHGGTSRLGIHIPRIDITHLLEAEASTEIDTVAEHYLEQAPTPEIACRRGLPVSQVRRELRRGLAYLRRMVTDG